MKTAIRNFALNLGVDDLGFASVEDYHSPKSPPLDSLFPGVRSLVVLAFRELSSCDSPNPQIAMSGRLGLKEFAESASYQVARFIDANFSTPTMMAATSYPMNFASGKPGVAEVSLRQAAIAAGLGSLGRHHLVLHPRFGTRVLFTAVLTQLELASDPPVQNDVCNECGLCVTECPVGALDDATADFADMKKCLAHSQPFGLGKSVEFWSRFADATPDERKSMLQSPDYRGTYQAGFIGFQYYCFRCLAVCPVGRTS